jgi:hypothetical protein
MLKVNIDITFSKILSLLTLISSVIVSILLKSTECFIVGSSTATAIIVHKQYQDRVKQTNNGQQDISNISNNTGII